MGIEFENLIQLASEAPPNPDILADFLTQATGHRFRRVHDDVGDNVGDNVNGHPRAPVHTQSASTIDNDIPSASESNSHAPATNGIHSETDLHPPDVCVDGRANR